jgi:hypothetical protein
VVAIRVRHDAGMSDTWPPRSGPARGAPQPPFPPPAPPPPQQGTPPPPPPPPGGPSRPGWPAQPGPPPTPDGSGGGSRRGLLVALAVVVVLAVGALAAVVVLRGDDEPAGPPVGLTVDDLGPALLTVDDVGSDYRAADSGGADGGGGGDLLADENVTMTDDCRAAMATVDGDGGDPQDVGARFETAAAATIEHDIGLPTADGLSLDEFRAALDECESIEFAADGAAGRAAFSTGTVSGLGDAAFEWIVDMDVQAGGVTVELEIYALAWENDGVQSSITASPGVDGTTLAVVPVDRARILDLATVADARLSGVLAGV